MSRSLGFLIVLAASGLVAATNDGLAGVFVWILAAVLPVLLIAKLYRAGRRVARVEEITRNGAQ